MRDIRDDLHERLNAIDSRYADEMRDYDGKREALDTAHRSCIADLTRERDALAALLALEDRKAGAGTAPVLKPRILVPLGDFLITKAAAYGAVTKDELRTEADAAGYPEAKSGRSFHFVLMNIAKAGKLTRLADGRYAHPSPSPALGSLFGSKQEEEADMPTIM